MHTDAKIRTSSERIHVLHSEKKESVAELNRNHIPESTVSLNSENCLRMTGMLFGVSKKLSCHLGSFKIQFLKLLFFLDKVCQKSENTRISQNSASITIKIPPTFIKKHVDSEKCKQNSN